MEDEPRGRDVDFSALYDGHPEYIERRNSGSMAQAQIDIEVALFKVPQFVGLLDLAVDELPIGDLLEIGCATGELLASMPTRKNARRVGVDISPANVAAARRRFPQLDFECGDFRGFSLSGFDAVMLSDVLEHVPDDVAFLRDASGRARLVLVNLPLEDNWLNARRLYGPDDVSGHLRKYSLAQGLALFDDAGLEVLAHRRVWVHEGAAELARHALKRSRQGSAFSGPPAARLVKACIWRLARSWSWFGRGLLASNLFVLARQRS